MKKKPTSNNIALTINRMGEFTVSKDQCTEWQCGASGTKTFKYEVSIQATDRCIKAPEMFVIDNAVISDYFKVKYEITKSPCKSCEIISCEAIEFFKSLFLDYDAPHPEVNVQNITVIIRGSEHSFIKAEWSK